MTPTRGGPARNAGLRGDLYLALLRGINVGGRNKLAMADLREIFSEAGAAEVRTYIQSGNVLFRAAARRAREIPRTVHAAIAERLGIDAPIVTRTAEELLEVAANHPFARRGVPESRLGVFFLQDRPRAREVAALDPNRSTPDEFEVRGREIYVCCPGGAARSKLTTAWFDSRLRTTSTARNWRTLQELARRARE